jgi:hypothetical protein
MTDSAILGGRVQEQRFKRPGTGSQGFQLGGPLLNAPAASIYHMSIIVPRRDLLCLIGECCPADPMLPSGIPFKPLFTTAGAQLYAESVVNGLRALLQLWLTGGNVSHRQQCERAGVHSHSQLRAFFDCPVISMAHHHYIGPDDDTVLLPGLQDRPIKSLGKVQSPGPCFVKASWLTQRAHGEADMQRVEFNP